MSAPVSVVIPTYNGRSFISDALTSVFRQTLLPREIIVVDDASPDGTADFVSQVAIDAPVPLRLIRLQKNSGGPAHPTNVGIAEAASEFIAVLDHDDVFAPTKLEHQTQILIDHPAIKFVFSVMGRFGEPDKADFELSTLAREIIQRAEPREKHHLIDGGDVMFLLIKYGGLEVGYPGFIFRRNDWSARGQLDSTLRIASDFDFLLWLSARGPAAFVPSKVYFRREHGGNLSSDVKERNVEIAAILLRYLFARKTNHRGRARELRSTLLASSYWLRQVSRYSEAARMCLAASLHCGASSEVTTELSKVAVQWATSFSRSKRRKRWSSI